MHRAEVLDRAKEAVTQDRAATHGRPEDTFSLIADLWTVYLEQEVTSVDVAHLMILLKVARAKQNPTYADNHVDVAGYGACASELAELADLAHEAMQRTIRAMQHQVEISDVE